MTIGFIGINICGTGAFSPNMSLISKSIEKCTLSRALIIGVVTSFSYMGLILLDAIGGHMYDRDKRNPFYLILGFEAGFILLTCILACFRQLHI